MLETLKQRLGARRESEKGFTLIELMVVVLIIAILLAIAIPTFLGARNTANARAAQSDLNTALTAEQTFYANNQFFSGADSTGAFDAAYPGDIQAIEPNLDWAANASASVTNGSPNAVLPTIPSASSQVVMLTIAGNDQKCYSQYQVNESTAGVNPGTFYDVTAPTAGACPPPAAPTATPTAAHATTTDGTWALNW